MGNDEDQVRRTLGEYSQWLDDGRFEEWSDLFAEDARLVLAGKPTEGRAAIRALMEAIQPDGAGANTSPPTPWSMWVARQPPPRPTTCSCDRHRRA